MSDDASNTSNDEQYARCPRCEYDEHDYVVVQCVECSKAVDATLALLVGAPTERAAPTTADVMQEWRDEAGVERVRERLARAEARIAVLELALKERLVYCYAVVIERGVLHVQRCECGGRVEAIDRCPDEGIQHLGDCPLNWPRVETPAEASR